MTDNSLGHGTCHASLARLFGADGACSFARLKSRSGKLFSIHMERVSPTMTLLRLATAALLACIVYGPAKAEDAPVHHHALSLIGEPKYPADFANFDYVNPDAPKGGVVRMADI